ncbi:MAG: hypothetical protein GY940_00925 [bacterium]|nr:hypothetical protein [bacterium]
MPSATLVGKEETFRALGISSAQEIRLESLISKLREQFEQEYYDTEDVGLEILEGLQAVKDGKVDRRHWRKVLDEI